MSVKDKYAGDAAWLQWFELCSLAKCDEQYRRPLMEQVSSALGRAVDSRRCELSYGRDYLLAYFDEHFKLGGSVERPKPLKEYLLAKVPEARNGLRGVVLGTILSGEVLTMSRNIKLVEDGTQTRWYTYPKNYKDKELRGKKVLLIAGSFDAEVSDSKSGGGVQEKSTLHDVNLIPVVDGKCEWTSVQAAKCDIDLDKRWFYKKANEFIELSKKENKSEKPVTSAAMVYARANKISPTRPIVQRILGVKQGGAAKKIHQMEDSLKRFCKRYDIRSEGIEFMRALLNVSTAILNKEGILKELEEAK